MLATHITNKGLNTLINRELLEFDFKRLKTQWQFSNWFFVIVVVQKF